VVTLTAMTMAGGVLAHGPGYGDGGWWLIFPFFWLLFLGFVIFSVFRFRRRGGPWGPRQTGEGVLGERYARGEINEDEYRQRLKVLKENH
jgi:putative membrane protein